MCQLYSYHLRSIRAAEPRLLPGITANNFERASDVAQKLGYDGLWILACDDTKAESSFRVLWDTVRRQSVLLGTIGDPIIVEGKEHVEELLKTAMKSKATKVSSSCTASYDSR